MKRNKTFFIYFVIIAMLLQIAPINVLAAQSDSKKSSVSATTTSTTNWFNYSVISTSTDSLELSGSSISINGDIHTNGNFIFNGSKLDVQGKCEASSKIKANGSKINIANRLENSPILDVPNFYDNIKNTIKSDAQLIDGDKNYTGNAVTINKPTIINGNASFNTSSFNGTGCLIAEKNISFNVSTFNKNENQKFILSSANGNITINCSNVNLNGIIYAPNGTVTFNTSSLALKGKIIAKKIVFKGSTLSITNDYDDIVTFVDTNDSDFDGLPDSYESSVLIPAMMNKGITLHNPAPEEDIDGDGLSNLEEYKLGTNPTSADTDADGLTDYDEEYKYHTNPWQSDTDNDGLLDGTEVSCGLDPLKKDSNNNGIIDSQETIQQTLLSYKYNNIDTKNNGVIPEVTVTGKGDFNKQLDIDDISNNSLFKSINSIVGHPIEIKHDKTLQFDSAQIKFKVSSDVLANNDIDDLAIAWYDDSTNKLVPLKTEINKTDNSLSANVNHFSDYMVVNLKTLTSAWNVSQSSSTPKSQKADIVFVIDTSEWEGSEFDFLKENLDFFTQELTKNGVDARFGLVTYKSISICGNDSTKDLGWFDDANSLISSVNSITFGGGSWWASSAVDALDVARNKQYRSDVKKNIILVSNERYDTNGTSSNSKLTMSDEIGLLKNDNIIVSGCISIPTEALTAGVSDGNLGSYAALVEQTNGVNIREQLDFELLIQKITGSGKVPVRLSDGTIVLLDKDPSLGDYSIDTDGDGIPDLDELCEEETCKLSDIGIFDPLGTNVEIKYWTFKSNPGEKDTDGDGILDRIDGHPTRYDTCVAQYTDDNIVFNNGDKWNRFGKDIYAFYDELTNITKNMKSQTDWENFQNSDMYKDLQRLEQNGEIYWSVDELSAVGIVDTNGVRDYLTNKDTDLINDVFTTMTGKTPHYYKHVGDNWEDEGESYKQSWSDFFTGAVVTDAEATLTRYYWLDLNKIITGVLFLGTIVGATFLASEVFVPLAASLEAFGAKDTIKMFTGDFTPMLGTVLQGQVGEELTLEEEVVASEMEPLENAITDEEISEVREETEEKLELCRNGNCFTGDTLVSTSKGKIAIKDIKAGDQVYSEDPSTGEEGLKTVKRTFINETNILTHIYVGDTEIKVTPSHRIWVEGKGWMHAGEIKVGDKFRLYSRETKEVTNVKEEKLEDTTNVYNLEIEDWHTYFVANLGIWVHNGGCRISDIEEAEAEILAQRASNLSAEELIQLRNLLLDKSKGNLSSVMVKELFQGVGRGKYTLEIVEDNGQALWKISIPSSSTTVYISESTGKTVEMDYIVGSNGVRGSGYSRAVVPSGTERGHIKSVQEGALDNCIEDSPINIIPQTPEVNDPCMKNFETYRVNNCQGMQVETSILDNGYVRVQVPAKGIDVTYNPLSTTATDPIDGWPTDWYLHKGKVFN